MLMVLTPTLYTYVKAYTGKLDTELPMDSF